MIDLNRAQWRKATLGNGANTGCVEVAGNLPGVTAIRDSKRPEDGAHIITREAFAAFLAPSWTLPENRTLPCVPSR
jgi:hypothetical protein